MTAYLKEAPTPFDNAPIEGLYFLSGDVLARDFNLAWAKDYKFPVLIFPSQFEAEIWEGGQPDNPTVHLFGEMDISLRGTQETAYAYAQHIAEQVGYFVQKVGENQLELWGLDEEHLRLTYADGRIANIEVVHEDKEKARPREPLLTDEIRQRLPELYSQEKLGLLAQAIVKFFTPDAQATWYISEASARLKDGTYASVKEHKLDDDDVDDIIMFGLAIIYEAELGYVSQSELDSIRGTLGLPVERDRHFEPKTLKELKEFHEQDDGE